MKHLVISDIHGNRQALEAVLEEASEYLDNVICLGDVVGYGADPGYCFRRIKALEPKFWVMGNHDHEVVSENPSWSEDHPAVITLILAKNQLSEADASFLRARPLRQEGDALVLHGSLRDELYEYLVDPVTIAENLKILGNRTCFHGHSHVPGIVFALGDSIMRGYTLNSPIPLNESCFINPGSVGQPRDGDWRAAYAIWDTGLNTIQFHRVGYDVEAAQEAILNAGFPFYLADRLSFGR